MSEIAPATPVVGPPSQVGRALVAIASAIAILGVAVVLILTPPLTHLGLTYAGSADRLGLPSVTTERLSDNLTTELVMGPGTFLISLDPSGEPILNAAERAHLGEVRTLWLAFASIWIVSLGILVLAGARARGAAWFWRSLSRGATVAIGLLLVGAALALLAFNLGFTLFHQLFFPGGNWQFDPADSGLVRLYPTAFWQAAVGGIFILGLAASVAVLTLARRHLLRTQV